MWNSRPDPPINTRLSFPKTNSSPPSVVARSHFASFSPFRSNLTPPLPVVVGFKPIKPVKSLMRVNSICDLIEACQSKVFVLSVL